jgi:DNA-binding MarR family transcriptional regulator
VTALEAEGRSLSDRQAAVLRALDAPRNAAAVCKATGIPGPAVTRACDALLALKLITRKSAKLDRRCVVLARTAAGDRLAAGYSLPTNAAVAA